MAGRHSVELSLLISLASLLACGPGSPGGASDADLIAPGEPSLTLGYYTELGYQPLSSVPRAPVLWGTQGGTWTMPSVRIRGIASPALVWGMIALEASGEVLGRTEREHGFALAPEGWLESRAVALPIQHAAPRQFEAISDVYGQAALLAISVSDSRGRSAETSVLITLIEG